MEQLLICMSLSLIAGLLASRAAKAVRLPAVTSYLVAGLLLGPFFLGRLGLSGWGFGFGSLAQVESYGIITQVALGFIAFVIGNEFRLSALEKMGKQAVTVGILQAVITTVLVDIALVALCPAGCHLNGIGHHAGFHRLCHSPCRHPDGGQAVQGKRSPDPPAADGGRH